MDTLDRTVICMDTAEICMDIGQQDKTVICMDTTMTWIDMRLV